MTISANIILDSINPEDIRLTTVHVHMPRFLLAEVNTHRVFSRNARSTRAVPTLTLIREVRDNPFMPVEWLSNIPGMQGGDPLPDDVRVELEALWVEAANSAAAYAEKLFKRGLHKQWSGRLVEPFMWVDVLITSTDWQNFFALRDEQGAQPELQLVARAIRVAMEQSTPVPLKPGQWHLPYIRGKDWGEGYVFLARDSEPVGHNAVLDLMKKISAARCARLTIEPFDGDGSFEKELKRYDRLVTSKPVHASPVEHQATPDEWIPIDPSWMTDDSGVYANPRLHGNFRGFIQGRQLIEGNTVHG